MTKLILHDAPLTAQPVVYVVQDSDGLDLAWRWGQGDAMDGYEPNPWPLWTERELANYQDGYAAGLAQMRILYGDPMLARWVLDGCPAGNFDWTGDFSDVVAAEDRCDYVGM